ncbi:MAG TPA: amino acid decarboxylase, partial [Gemmatimonadaceae bacterium]|nr:amino acid decarboxylase [Gemmatimonadaceae bacterium]
MDPTEFQKQAHAIADWVARYRATIAERPVMARTAPGEIKAQLPSSPPQSPEPFDAMLRDFETIVVPGITHW